MLLGPVQACDLSLDPHTHLVLFNTTTGIHRRATIRLCCILAVFILDSFEGLSPLGVWWQIFVGVVGCGLRLRSGPKAAPQLIKKPAGVYGFY